METKPILQKDSSGRELCITRLLNAPRELVFKVWTEPEHIVNWWGPTGFTNTIHQMDVKPGGIWTHTMHGPDGRDYPNKIIFLEVIKPKRLVYKHSGEEGTENVTHHVTVDFEEQGNKTLLSMKMVFGSAEELERINKEYGVKIGLTQTIGRMEEYLTKF